MKYAGETVELFDKEEVTNDLCMKFWVIHAEFLREKKPLIPERYIEEFQKRYHVGLNEAEIIELKDYAQFDYSDNVHWNIQMEKDSGLLTEVKLKGVIE